MNAPPRRQARRSADPYTVAADTTRAYRVCWLNYEALEPGTASAFTDGEGIVVCADCTSCTDPDCDHPLYAYATHKS
jgi:hypothetical protein